MNKKTLNKKGEMTLLKLLVGFLVVIGIFISIFLFTGMVLTSNNWQVSGVGNATFTEMGSALKDMNQNDSVAQLNIISQSGENVTSTNPDPFRQTYDKGNQYGIDYMRFFPKMGGVLNTALQELQVNIYQYIVLGTILAVTIAYLIISFIRVGR